MNAQFHSDTPLVPFRNRSHAGQVLASHLKLYVDRPGVLVLGLPRGGVPVAYEVAKALHAPLDILLVRKLGVPGQKELAMGAIASGGMRVLNRQVITALGIGEDEIETVMQHESRELERRERLYRNGRPATQVSGRTLILVDDGLATGASMRVAVEALRSRGPHDIVVAVPVGARATCDELRGEVDDLVCARTPEQFYAVGMWYEDFSQVTDDDICELLNKAALEIGRPTEHYSRP
ncbi:MAG: phosphoribosyltransferase [Acidobacteria bacterium]|nr:phosphoribosyltransferase [Acidobacteriota bacterium]